MKNINVYRVDYNQKEVFYQARNHCHDENHCQYHCWDRPLSGSKPCQDSVKLISKSCTVVFNVSKVHEIKAYPVDKFELVLFSCTIICNSCTVVFNTPAQVGDQYAIINESF